MKTIASIVVAILLASTSLFGQTGRSLYYYWGAGVSRESFSSEVRADGEGNVVMEQRFGSNVSAEVLGFYWPLDNHHTIVGIVSNGAFDGDEVAKASFDLTTFTTSGSVMHFVTDTVGVGFMLRGDVGLAGHRVTGSNGEETKTDVGLGMVLGVGYGFRADVGNVVVGANVTLRRIGSQNFNGYGLSVGLLW